MGKYYAEAQGEDEAVAHAIEDHYKPHGPDDRCRPIRCRSRSRSPTRSTCWSSFWAIDEKPTGRKDPYALRRAALGVIRLDPRQSRCACALLKIVDADRRICRSSTICWLLRRPPEGPAARAGRASRSRRCGVCAARCEGQDDLAARSSAASRRSANSSTPRTARTCSPAPSAPPTSCASRRRRTRANIVGKPDPSLYRQDEEWALAKAIDAAKEEAAAAVAREDFAAAMTRDGEAAPACRRVLRQGDGQRRRQADRARTGCACSTKSARRPARSRISRGSKVSARVTCP